MNFIHTLSLFFSLSLPTFRLSRLIFYSYVLFLWDFRRMYRRVSQCPITHTLTHSSNVNIKNYALIKFTKDSIRPRCVITFFTFLSLFRLYSFFNSRTKQNENESEKSFQIINNSDCHKIKRFSEIKKKSKKESTKKSFIKIFSTHFHNKDIDKTKNEKKKY